MSALPGGGKIPSPAFGADRPSKRIALAKKKPDLPSKVGFYVRVKGENYRAIAYQKRTFFRVTCKAQIANISGF
ncbi:MAG: hypothetical protein JOY96_11235 [Verrucomicrobia bacterium]|nr:hypothetical protein [Verrucomicrobiota bacterium]MBV9673547.1 hypothetical protein [Verrucomicrobiota bacterium]